MKKRFLTHALTMGVLTAAILLQTIPAQAKPGNSGGGNSGSNPSVNNSGGNSGSNLGSNNSGGNSGGGNSGGTTNISNLPLLSNHPCMTSDVTLGGSAAQACFGQVATPANDVGRSPTLLDFLNSSEDRLDFGYIGQWLAAGQEIQNGSGTALGFTGGTFAVNAASGKTGTWSLSLSRDLIQALVISVKGGTGWSAYLFDPTTLASSFSGNWTTLGLQNNGGQQPDISHISAYYVAAAGEPEPIPTPALIPGAMAAGAALLRQKKREKQDRQNV